MHALPRLHFTLTLLLAASLSLTDLYGQSARRGQQRTGERANAGASSEQGNEDAVPTLKIDGDKKQEDTQSGQKEGLPEAPALVETPDAVQGQKPSEDETPPEEDDAKRNDAASESFATARVNARTMVLEIPAPRGQILDRHGLPLAQTVVAYQLALRFGQFENEDRDYVVGFARRCLEEAHKITERTWDIKDELLWQHYRHRRWLALPLTNAIRAEDAEKIRDKVEAIRGLELLPIYIRYYPQGQSAAHIIGYVGSQSKLPLGPINYKDPLWERTEGRSGLEKEYNEALTGRGGTWRLMFNEDGAKILDELQIKPRPGGSVVTTIDLKWQKEAEKVLAKRARRGAFVVLDCKTGEVLVLASTPSYDPNKFIPNISTKDYQALVNDPAKPLLSRAFQGEYPPASTFKVVTILSALANGSLSEHQTINCPASIQIGNHLFRNHNNKAAGSINCIQALAWSNNIFMCYAAWNLDGRGGRNAPRSASFLLEAARKLGFGSRAGIQIADSPGLVPSENYMLARGRNFTLGDLANMSIGQGTLLATPLQVAHAMAGIANGYGLPKLHIIKQVQDGNANVIETCTPSVQTPFPEYEAAAAIVRKGMKSVIEGGTGSRARLSYISSAGKTGTAQWGRESENRRLAWFAGFLPADNPRFAYAALYEGLPNERIGGGAIAAPIVKDFFEAVKKDVKTILDPSSDKSIPVAEPVEEEAPPQPVQPRPTDDLPSGLYDPGDVIPIPAHAIPVDIDDSADAPIHAEGFDSKGRPIKHQTQPSPALYPQPGDSDYIPGLQEQIPRHLNPERTRRNGDNPPPSSREDNIPVAEPVIP